MTTKYPNRSIVLISDNGIRVQGLRDEEPPGITGGYGGWEVTPRPRRVGLTQWMGKDPIRMKIPLLFDGYAEGDPIEDDVSNLSRMALPPEKGGGEPPVVDIRGAVPLKRIDRWVIESLEWGTNVIWGFGPSGAALRFRQDVVVNVLEYIDPSRIFLHPKPKPKRRPRPRHKFHIVKRGETLAKISAIEYGNSKYWRDIAKANHIRDPKHIHVGQRLMMP